MATKNPITRYREADRAIRGIARNQGRNRATTDALHRHWNDQDAAVRLLMAENTDTGRYIVGLLSGESAMARRDWRNRPFDLKPRMLEIQRELRRLERELDRQIQAELRRQEELTNG